MFTVGAQGMNTGIQDGYNLAWKLALVLNGKADDSGNLQPRTTGEREASVANH